jgi:hypothetical protein
LVASPFEELLCTPVRFEDQDFDVQTAVRPLRRRRGWRGWTAVWAADRSALLWLRMYDGPTTPGGLAEAHEHVVDTLRRGALPAKD